MNSAQGLVFPHLAMISWIDGAVIVGYLALATILGVILAGRQKSARDFYLGGRNLPWPAVAGSIIATEISAITYVAVPFLIYRDGGNLTYLQLGVIGTLLARLLVARFLIPAYFKRRIYSPYDFMGNTLGHGVHRLTSGLFCLGGVLAQSARIFLTALVLELVLAEPLAWLAQHTGLSTLFWAVAFIGVVGIVWTWLGGMATVIWTDVLLFLVFVLGTCVSLIVIVVSLPGGWGEILAAGQEAGKFTFWDWDPAPWKTFTVWTAVFAAVIFNVGAYGTDQLMTQRLFCCRSARDAQKAMVASYLGIGLTALIMILGIALYAYTEAFPLTGRAAELYAAEPNRIFPIFMIEALPVGIAGLALAGIFAAAISSFDSILAALAQTSQKVIATWKKGLDEESAFEEDSVGHSRWYVLFWGIVLCGMAILIARIADDYPTLLDLALALASYTVGTLLAGFFLAFLPLGINGRGYLFSAPLGVATVLAASSPPDRIWVYGVFLLLAFVLLICWFSSQSREKAFSWKKLAVLTTGLAIPILVQSFLYFTDPGSGADLLIAWPWNGPIGFLVAFIWGWALAEPHHLSAQRE